MSQPVLLPEDGVEGPLDADVDHLLVGVPGREVAELRLDEDQAEGVLERLHLGVATEAALENATTKPVFDIRRMRGGGVEAGVRYRQGHLLMLVDNPDGKPMDIRCRWGGVKRCGRVRR